MGNVGIKTHLHALAKVDKGNRIHVTKALLRSIGWVPEDDKDACLLLGGFGRSRLLADREVQNDADCIRLREQIGAIEDEKLASLVNFREEPLAVLPLRMLPVDMTPHGMNYRLTLPKMLTSVFRIRAGEDAIAVLVSQGHIELWSVEALTSAAEPSIEELI